MNPVIRRLTLLSYHGLPAGREAGAYAGLARSIASILGALRATPHVSLSVGAWLAQSLID